ncbi:MAG: polyprenyl synthetase family protein [Lachnospiraceae bacterium]|nr:polyprenyl synthetase family protein [Lachnospiraceae bacterium]
MDFKMEMKERVSYIDKVIKGYLPKEEGFEKTLLSAMNYSILAGGKRIRPMLMLETYRLFGGEQENEISPFLAAMEMIHTYSLVHDDLPAMDDDDYRRGRLTTHKVYGEAMGILAGDALLNYSFEVAAWAFSGTMDIFRVAKAFTVLTRKPGIGGMIGGQAVDVENCDHPIDKDKLDFIYLLKTGALIEGSMMIGAILAGAKDAEVEEIEEAGRKIGLAFQIQDDVLDVIGDEQVIGKPINSDEKNHKTTYVTLFGLEEAKKKVEILSMDAIKVLEKFPKRNKFLEELVRYLIFRNK